MDELRNAQIDRLARVKVATPTQRIDLAADILLGSKDVTPKQREKLKGLLKYYAKKPHPFRACVRDNMKRFGPGRTEAVCATLKDLIRGTTKWRGHNNPKDKGSKGLKGLSEETFEFDEELEQILLSISDEQIDTALQLLEGGDDE